MTSTLDTINNREVIYLDVSNSLDKISLFPKENWLLFVIADKAQIPLLDRFAELSLKHSPLFVCASGEASQEAEDAFDDADLMNRLNNGENTDAKNAFEDSPPTTAHGNLEEGVWFAIVAANNGESVIEKVVVANLTQTNYRKTIEGVLKKIKSGWLPAD
ncbi:MAG: hypothetical protein IPP73_18580 [Chitinophagaceae bacterium]|nr:hypothetical protein [Chitinophagaceae bacterium]